MEADAGVVVDEGPQGRRVKFTGVASLEVIQTLLDALRNEGLEFRFHDPLYMDEEDGAYFSYRPGSEPSRAVWEMTLGNHGWSGGIYEVDSAVLCRQLKGLHDRGLLEEVGLERVCFFAHYPRQDTEANLRLNQELRELHG
jgi:hypothetical protein